ncbi:hypothetical protein ASF11_02605 [Acidovorax sp. Leaf76]|uniref:DUF1772 domain-containing protein n=1 Tax=unclassified Acidovorax TaxID=2684926 RepID=UPI0006FDEFAE|nr:MULTISPECIES: DUF1772 domain-containing protein [unclassified Acidovorax]KQO26598.1 hypothetical protein ASF11_02605 [Acidovorax sp. Leaf76]KQO40373.1 hypothetical protein ASF19_01645 [Acidovorax sp. Leaf84]KQS42511.1 hypothetical protein ASG27_01580 [Acidovorax sp. Leaf191]
MPNSHSTFTTSGRSPLALAPHALAVLWLGLMAGFFGTYSANVNLALLQMDGAIYATVQSALNRNVRHALFFTLFFGPPLWCALALATAWREHRAGWWRGLGLVGAAYGLGIMFFTQQVNLPLNHTTESWTPQALPADWADVRDRWNAANLWRAGLSLAAFAAALGTLVWRSVPQARPGLPAAPMHDR